MCQGAVKPLMYVVDYDLPAGTERQRFYRAVKRYLREHLMEETGWSTYSVVFTPDPEFALFVYMWAHKVGGRANMYEARRLEIVEMERLAIRTLGGGETG